MSEKVILLPCENDVTREQFEKSVIKGIPFHAIRSLLSDAELQSIHQLKDSENIRIWGLSESNYQGYLMWRSLRKDDYATFFCDDKLFHKAKIGCTTNNESLSRAIWGESNSGTTWNLLLFLTDCESIDIEMPKNLSILGLQRSKPLLLKNDDETTSIILDLIGADDEGGNIRIPKNLEIDIDTRIETIINSTLDAINPEHITRNLLPISELNEPSTHRIRVKRITAVCMARNKTIARFVKERAGYRCEVCGIQGFEQTNGEMYAEAHH